MQCVILFGGGGIVGSELSRYYEGLGYELINISLEFPLQGNNERRTNIIGDVNSSVLILPLVSEIINKYDRIHAAVFIVAPEVGLFSRILSLLETQCDSVALISTIYADEKLRYYHPYFDKKRNEEKVISSSRIKRKYIFRLPHVIGNNTLIGCVPPYNRVSVDRIAESKLLGLYIDNDISIYYIDPSDIPAIIGVLYDQYATTGCTVNLFNARVSTAIKYFNEILRIANSNSKVECIGEREIEEFWSFTTLDMNMDTGLMGELAGEVIFTSLRSSLISAANTSLQATNYRGNMASRISNYDT